jgi:glycosyltransferase involved in cell wall biosynthesis
MTTPLVSVLIDTYNHERFIEEAIESVLSQDFPASEREILVVDDGSTDRTPEILAKFASQIRILRKPNGGQASAFNCGIPLCRGEFISFLDGDDRWRPEKLSRIADVMSQNPSVGVVGHGIHIASDDNTILSDVAPEKESSFRLDSVVAAENFRLVRCFFGTSRLTLRSGVARKVLPVPESLIFEADEYLFTLAPALSDAILIPDLLSFYRLHGANLFLASGGSRNGERRKQRVLATLTLELRRALREHGVSPDVVEVLAGMVELEATQLRLKLDGGFPWETFRTETSLYRISHSNLPVRSRAFRTLSMLPALLLPPRWFYAGREWLGSKTWYRMIRRSVIPSPAFLPVKPTALGTSTLKKSR